MRIVVKCGQSPQLWLQQRQVSPKIPVLALGPQGGVIGGQWSLSELGHCEKFLAHCGYVRKAGCGVPVSSLSSLLPGCAISDLFSLCAPSYYDAPPLQEAQSTGPWEL